MTGGKQGKGQGKRGSKCVCEGRETGEATPTRYHLTPLSPSKYYTTYETLSTLLQSLRYVAATGQAIRRAKRYGGHVGKGLYIIHISLLIAVWYVSEGSPTHAATIRQLWQHYSGMFFSCNYEALRKHLNKLVESGYLSATLAAPKGRTITRYSLTITAVNFLTDIDKHMQKCKKAR